MNVRDGDDDARLIARIARRDGVDEALEALYDAYAPRLYSVSLHMCGEPLIAEEAVQETFVTVWRSAVSYAPERGRVSTWLFAILRSRTLDLIRAQRRRPTPAWVTDAAVQARARPGTAVTESAEEKVMADELHATVAELPDDYRRVVELSYFGGYTHMEIAHLLGIPLGTVKSRIRIGLERLARMERGVEPDERRDERGTAM